MKIQLISHASVTIETSDAYIWTDPWLVGKVFNDSWSLLPSAQFNATLYNTIHYLWISHEHPDHFHIPTLRTLPATFKERVTLLFQQNNSNKMEKAFRQLGFQHIQFLPHRKIVQLSGKTSIYCYQQGQMNSVLGVMERNETVLNVNDAELNTRDCRIICRDIGSSTVILNQFSLAGSPGYQDCDAYLPVMAQKILSNMSENHHDLQAQVTIPFASFIYFSSEDNKYINFYANKPCDVVNYLAARGQRTVILYPGDVYDTSVPYDSAEALARFDEVYDQLDSLPSTPSARISLDELERSFRQLTHHIHERYTKLLLSFLKPVAVYVPDLDQTIEFSINHKRFSAVHCRSANCDLIINSQPLYFAFSFPYGVQTLGVSARFTLLNNIGNWKLHRILFSMNNAELYLTPRYFFTRSNLHWLSQRLIGGISQIRYTLQRM